MPFSRRVLTAVIALAMALVPALWASTAFASTADDLDAARAKLASARESANEAVASFTAAENKLAETENKIADLTASINDLKAKAASLKDIVRERARYAYTHQGEQLDLMVDADGPVQAARRSQLLDHANQQDNDAVKKLAIVNDDLKRQQDDLKSQLSQQQTTKDQLEAKASDLKGKLADAQSAATALQQKLEAEAAAARAAADAEKAKALAAEAAAVKGAQQVSNGGAGQIISAPTISGFTCPVSGASYGDDFGGARAHGGIDMFVPMRTPAVAVKGGSVTFVPNEGAGGNAAYLNANDGNVYYYAHFDSYVGPGGRSVSAGEIIGLTGMTGNTSASHLHFEIRLGGANGTKTNPYPTLRGAGC
ncbi:MAG: peptidoglycan DD-metalloendopeptidase family protein [Acidimicrobiia bacterium]